MQTLTNFYFKSAESGNPGIILVDTVETRYSQSTQALSNLTCIDVAKQALLTFLLQMFC